MAPRTSPLVLAIVAAALGAPLSHAQVTETQPVFDVVSVKPVAEPYMSTRPTRSGGRITWQTQLWYLIGYAYNLVPNRLGPIPGSEKIYRVDAVTDPAATEDQIRLMFRSMLADRFKMAARLVTKDSDGYALNLSPKAAPRSRKLKREKTLLPCRNGREMRQSPTPKAQSGPPCRGQALWRSRAGESRSCNSPKHFNADWGRWSGTRPAFQELTTLDSSTHRMRARMPTLPRSARPSRKLLV